VISTNKAETIPAATPARKSPGYALVAEALNSCGITRVVGVTGTPVDQIFPECAARGIRTIGARHQQGAVLMAAASNYISGRIEAAVVVSAGPAVTNALTGVLVARENGWPVIVIGGRRPVHNEGIGYFQELDAVPIFQPVTKWAATIDHPSKILTSLTRAYEIAMDGRPGPVYLDLPEDVLRTAVEPGPAVVPEAPQRHYGDSATVARCADLIRKARRPLLILGEDIRWGLYQPDLRDLIESNRLPFVTSPLGRGFLPDDHPLCANAVRRSIPCQADLVLMAGAWFDWRFRFGAELARDSPVIHVGADLATLGRNVPKALTVHADSGRFLTQLKLALQAEPPDAMEREIWVEQITVACEERHRQRAAWVDSVTNVLAPQTLFSELRKCLPHDAIVVLDGNITLAVGQALLSAQTPCGWLDPGSSGCMGVGIPLGIGAKLTAPDRMVVVVCGDFGFGLSATELETAARQRIPIIVIVMNNDGITGALRQLQRFPPDYPELFSRFQPTLRYDTVSQALGCHSEFVTERAAIGPAFARAAASGIPACINVRVDPLAAHPGFW